MVVVCLVGLGACEDDANNTAAGVGGAGATGGAAATGGGGGDGGNGAGGGEIDPCPAFGIYGVPENTFVLPTDESTYYPDIQDAFPEVDWQTLDRLFIPAGVYTNMNIGNLPERDASRPLVITNQGGQVQIGPNTGGNYIWSMGGGSNWILTGRYDPESQTGHEDFPGHRCGAYATSRGRYGFLSDDAFDLDAPYLHMGLSIGNATDFELEYLEITRSGFAGIRLLNSASDGTLAMANVKLHDNYVHDVDGEGIYLGWTGAPPSNLLPGLEVFNNRFVRTGNEALQIQNLGDGTHVHHNTIVYGGMRWRDNGLGAYQDSNSQIQMREGTIVVEENVFIGSASTLWSSFRGAEGGDGPIDVTYRNNYVSHNRVGLAAYLGGEADGSSAYTFEGNVFRVIDFSYDEIDPAATDDNLIFRFSPDITSPIMLVNNRWEGDNELVAGLGGPNGTTGAIVATGNDNGAVTPIEVESGLAEGPFLLELWTNVVSRAPGDPPRNYAEGELVIYLDGKLYRATAANTDAPPPDNPQVWEQLPDPVDDLRVVASSPYVGWGIQ